MKEEEEEEEEEERYFNMSLPFEVVGTGCCECQELAKGSESNLANSREKYPLSAAAHRGITVGSPCGRLAAHLCFSYALARDLLPATVFSSFSPMLSFGISPCACAW